MIKKSKIMISRAFQKIIRTYQKIFSPFLGKNCRFEPSCSEYVVLTIEKHGVAKGLIKGVGRILRCSRLSRGGVDVP